MKRILQILLLIAALGCASSGQKGIVQPNKIEHKNQFVSRVIPKSEATKKTVETPAKATEPIKLENGGKITPQEKVTSTNISIPKQVKEESGIIYVTKDQLEKIQEPNESEGFWDKLFRYSLFWFTFVGFIAIAVYAFRKNKIPSINPFKKKEQKKEPSQLNLNL
jgi:hypothetical protein